MSEGTKLVAVIGDEDTVTGFILAGIGHRTADGTNFLVVKPILKTCHRNGAIATPISVIEASFRLLSSRDDIAIILINQHVAEEIRHLLNTYEKTIPTVLEIPSKDLPYDPAKDYIMKRVNLMLGLLKASQDLRIDRLPSLHNKPGYTTGGGVDRANQACPSSLQHSLRSANPACWQKPIKRNPVARPRLTYGAARHELHQHDRDHLSPLQR
ncbi:hypothetical protein CCR75_006173 [Bremia lactucae]|uniref:V-type proton ATPase subunit F n=1 Tax=Bremia lactucae TaxID=4779 RepID=A0A976IJJ1_BRELC|nr:hypothetical protein CCR75_006173 [Bremia lactucae]